MNRGYISQIDNDDELDEYPEITQDDFDRATFRVGLKPAARTEGIPIVLDAAIVEYFKGVAGEGEYQGMINETLRDAILGLSLEERLRRIIREEMRTPA